MDYDTLRQRFTQAQIDLINEIGTHLDKTGETTSGSPEAILIAAAGTKGEQLQTLVSGNFSASCLAQAVAMILNEISDNKDEMRAFIIELYTFANIFYAKKRAQ